MAGKPKRKPKARSKITLEIPADLKCRLLCYAASRDEYPWQVVARAVEREVAGFYFATKDRSANDSPILKIG
jgi:hypothetical protein